MGNDVVDSATAGSSITQGVASNTMGISMDVDVDDKATAMEIDLPNDDHSLPNPFGVLTEFASIIEARYGNSYSRSTAPTARDTLYANRLFDSLLSIMEEYIPQEDEEILLPEEVLPENLLDVSDKDGSSSDEDEQTDDSEEEFEDDAKNDPTFKPSSRKRKRKSDEPVTMERKVEIVELWEAHKGWSLNTFKKKGKLTEVGSIKTLYRYKKQIARRTRLQKLHEIDQYVLQQVKENRNTFKILRASHLRTFAMQKYMQFNDPTLKFKASISWLTRFKKRHNISSRKITRLVSKREIREEQQILDSAKAFQEEIQELSSNFDPDHVINTDQCGFQYEMTSTRTLTFKGAKEVFGYAASPKNLCTHSYTVQYIISLSGKIIGNVFICLQESGCKLGQNVKRDVESYLPKNVTLTCSSSGKMSTFLNDYFIEKQIVPHMTENFLCIVDSWAGHNKLANYEKFFGKKLRRPNITLKVVPEKCTPLCQPLDTNYHRQYKYTTREIVAALEVFINTSDQFDPDKSWKSRKGVIMLHSLLHFLMSAPIFQPMIRYSWYSAGLTTDKAPFLNAKEVLFTFATQDSLTCEITGCTKERFIKCSNCRKCLCLHHLCVAMHAEICENSPFL